MFGPECLATPGGVNRERVDWNSMEVMVTCMFALACRASLASYNIFNALGAGAIGS